MTLHWPFQGVKCWETILSQKFYQLVVMNLIFEWAFSFIVFLVAQCYVRFSSGRKQIMFRADLLIQRLIYLQVATYLASYYSPVLCGITIFSTLVILMRDLVSLFSCPSRNCLMKMSFLQLLVRLTKLYKSAPLGSGSEVTQVVYCAVLLVSFLFGTASVAFAITA